MLKFFQDYNVSIGIIGSISSIIGIFIAIIQTIKFRQSEKMMKIFRRNNNANIWTNISLILQAYETIDDLRSHLNEINIEKEKNLIYSKVNSTRRTIVNLYITLLKEAIVDEEKFDLDTIDKWKKTGRLENEWRVNHAKKLIQSTDISMDFK